MHVSWPRFVKQQIQERNKTNVGIDKRVTQSKEWRPAFRDLRSYKEVVSRHPVVQSMEDLTFTNTMLKAVIWKGMSRRRFCK